MVSAVTSAIARGNGSLLYDSDIRAIIGGDSQAISGSAEGQYFSVLCTDNQFVSLAEVRADLAKVNPAFSTYLDFTGDFVLCQSWPYRQRTPNDYSAVTGPVPTLLVSDVCRTDPCQGFSESQCLQGGLGQFEAKYLMPLALSNAGRMGKYGA